MIFFAFPFAALLLVGVHVWFYRRFCRPLRARWMKVVGISILALSFGSMSAGHVLARTWPSMATRTLQNTGYVFMALALYVAVALAMVDVVARLGGGLLRRKRGTVGTATLQASLARVAEGKASATEESSVPASANTESRDMENPSAPLEDGIPEASPSAAVRSGSGAGESPDDPGRRRFLKATSLASLALAASATGGGAAAAFRCPVKPVDIPLKGLPPSMEGFTIALLSDIHVGGWIGRDFVQGLVDRTNGISPDVVLVCGDLVDGRVEDLKDLVAPLEGLVSRLGTFFTIGNHEIYSGVEPWCDHLRGMGVQVLRNRCAALDGIDLLGVDDWSAGRRGVLPGYDLDQAMEGRRPGVPAILMTHQPRGFRAAAERGIGLQLSGHTHGGQLLPFQPLAQRANDGFLAGLYRHGDARLYVTRGCGFWGPPVRLGAPSEITRIRLVRDGE